MSDDLLVIDIDYVIMWYLQQTDGFIEEQRLLRDVIKIITDLWREDFEVKVSFERNTAEELISPEINASLRRLRQAGIVEDFLNAEGLVYKRVVSDAIDRQISRILTSHENSFGAVKKIVCKVLQRYKDSI